MPERLQPGIYIHDRTVPRSHHGAVFLRSVPGAAWGDVAPALGAAWGRIAALRRGEVPELPGHPVPACNLDASLGLGPRAFRLAGAGAALPADLGPEFWFRSPRPGGGGVLLAGSGLHFAPDVRANPATEDFAVQLFADSRLAVSRAILELDRSIRASAVLEIVSIFEGFSREDHRSWLGFHDGVSNLEPGEERHRAIAIKPTNRSADAWTEGGTYVAFLRLAVDLAAWDALPRAAQEMIVGRDKLTGMPLESIGPDGRPVSRCPFGGAREAFPPAPGAPPLETPDVSEEALRMSHAQRANHHRRDVENRDSLRIYRQSFEELEPGPPPRPCVNFTCHMDTPERLVRLLTQPGWLGRTNFGGDPQRQPPGLAGLLGVRAAGVFLLPPVLEGEPFPGARALSGGQP